MTRSETTARRLAQAQGKRTTQISKSVLVRLANLITSRGCLPLRLAKTESSNARSLRLYRKREINDPTKICKSSAVAKPTLTVLRTNPATGTARRRLPRTTPLLPSISAPQNELFASSRKPFFKLGIRSTAICIHPAVYQPDAKTVTAPLERFALGAPCSWKQSRR